MKFYETHNPYYALIKANTLVEAVEKYIENVSGDDVDKEDLIGEFTEVSRDYALVKFSQAPNEDKLLLPVSVVIDELNAQQVEVMIIDGSLI